MTIKTQDGMLYKQNQHRFKKKIWIMNDNRNPITNKKKEKKTLYIELIYYGSPQNWQKHLC
jgi:hypothetical protein